MVFEYCAKCGDKLILKEIGDEGKIPYCQKCKRPYFSFSYPCVICLVTDGKDFALIKQAYVSENYVCVAGYLKQGETPESAAKREVEEETGLTATDVRYIRSYYHAKGDNLMLGFVCRVKRGEFGLSGEVDSADWFSPEQARVLLAKSTVCKILLSDYEKSEQSQQ